MLNRNLGLVVALVVAAGTAGAVAAPGVAQPAAPGDPFVVPAAGEVSCRLPNGQVVRLTPRDCAARGGTVVGG